MGEREALLHRIYILSHTKRGQGEPDHKVCARVKNFMMVPALSLSGANARTVCGFSWGLCVARVRFNNKEQNVEKYLGAIV